MGVLPKIWPRCGLLVVAGLCVLAPADGVFARRARHGHEQAAVMAPEQSGGTVKYEFIAAPETDLNRIYRLDRATGEIGACQYGLKDTSAVGVTLCYPPGDGAGPQGASEYALIASHHQGEGGVFRVDLHSGLMSICYVLNDAVVCTPPAK